jgi:hypothetical protein
VDQDVFVHELPATTASAIRINAGGVAYTDRGGLHWRADSGFNTGNVANSSAPIRGTVDGLLYQSIRWDDAPAPDLQYKFAVPNGRYLVKLHFAKTNPRRGYKGARVFDVDIEGSMRFDNIDVFAQSGGINTALVKSSVVNVIDGQLNILFRHQVRSPIISAIEVLGR